MAEPDPVTDLADELRRFQDQRAFRVMNSLWRTMIWQFLRGLAFGLGTLMGATVLVSLIAWWASQIAFIPILGEWLNQIVLEMERGR